MELFKRITNIRERDSRPCEHIHSSENYEKMLNDTKKMGKNLLLLIKRIILIIKKRIFQTS